MTCSVKLRCSPDASARIAAFAQKSAGAQARQQIITDA
jgi:hypothetical protein